MTDAPYDIIMIGGGIIGLSVAMELSRTLPRLRLPLIEKEDRVSRHQNGHNSGVIHSGVYYKPGSPPRRPHQVRDDDLPRAGRWPWKINGPQSNSENNL